MLYKLIGLLSALRNEEWKRAHRRQTERLVHIPGHCNRRIMMNLSLPLPPRTRCGHWEAAPPCHGKPPSLAQTCTGTVCLAHTQAARDLDKGYN